MSKALNVGVLGLGTVGAGTLRVLAEGAEEIRARAGRDIVIRRAAVRDVTRARDCALSGIPVDSDPQALVKDPEIDVVVELIGGVDTARELVLQALASGKDVVTANKALIAEHGEEIFHVAREHGRALAFEAAVAGGIPIIKALREGLAGNRIASIAGIINGTTNYILTEMEAGNGSFAEILAEAQKLGYAEADPSFDVDGIDAAHKLAILATLAWDMPLSFAHMQTVGIGKVDIVDLEYAAELGYRVKHLAMAQRRAHKVELWVEPTLVPLQAYVAKIDGVMNGLSIGGNAVGTTGFFGPGAGGLATASAVVADLVDLARGHALLPPTMSQDLPVVYAHDRYGAHYLRMEVEDRSGVMQSISQILAERDISIESIVQREVEGEEVAAEIVLVTHQIKDSQLDEAMDEIAAGEFLRGEIRQLRVEHLDA